MTDQRKSVVVAFEDGFGTGTTKPAKTGDTYSFYKMPPGTKFGHNFSNTTNDVFETGNKQRIGVTYGYFTGQWSLGFKMDYVHLEPFAMFYDAVVTVSSFSSGQSTAQTVQDGVGNDWAETQFTATTTTGKGRANLDIVIKDVPSGKTYIVPNPPDGKYVHLFLKRNIGVPEPYILREKTMHRMVGGATDEVTEMWGCIPTSLRIQKGLDSSMDVEIGGILANQRTLAVDLDSTDWTVTSSEDMTQQSCMLLDSQAVADVDSFEVTVNTNVQPIFNICSRRAMSYSEGNNSQSWSASTYHNQVNSKFLKRAYTGGVAPETTETGPRMKNMAPMEDAKFLSFTDTADSSDGILSTYATSDNSLQICAKNSTISSMTWDVGNNQVMKQKISNASSDRIYMAVVNGCARVWREGLTTAASNAGDTVNSTIPSADVYNYEIGKYYFNGGSGTETTYTGWGSNGNLKFSTMVKPGLPFLGYVKWAAQDESTTKPDDVTLDGYVIIPYDSTGTKQGASTVSKRLYNVVDKTLTSISGSIASGKESFIFDSPNTNIRCTVKKKSADDSTCQISISAIGVTVSGVTTYTLLKGRDCYIIAKPTTLESTTYASGKTGEDVTAIGYLVIDVV